MVDVQCMDGVESEHLARAIRDRQHRAERDLAASSSLPRDVFETCDPMVEAVLADAALRVFQRHMGREEHPEIPKLTTALPEAEHIPSEELRACAEQLAALPDEGTPDLEQGLRG